MTIFYTVKGIPGTFPTKKAARACGEILGKTRICEWQSSPREILNVYPVFKMCLENRQAIVNEALTMKSKKARALLNKFGFSSSEITGIITKQNDSNRV